MGRTPRKIRRRRARRQLCILTPTAGPPGCCEDADLSYKQAELRNAELSARRVQKLWILIDGHPD